GIVSNILALLGIIIALLPQKDTISIDNSTNYYFRTTYSTSSRTTSNMEWFFVLLIIIVTYIFYALLQPYFVGVLIILAFALIVRYRYLKIAFKKQMVLPLLLIITTAIIQQTLPAEIISYWKNAYKIDFNHVDTLSQILQQLTTPINEIYNLIKTIYTSPLSVAVLSNIIFVIFSLVFMLSDLFRKKENIKVEKLTSLIPISIIFFIIISFMFYTNPNSPARTIVTTITHFLTD
ncbi:hypothetical protein EPK33_15170, partial [Enterococcus faecalis]|nr:hypothetical protein [Enterococcus faecalis]